VRRRPTSRHGRERQDRLRRVRVASRNTSTRAASRASVGSFRLASIPRSAPTMAVRALGPDPRSLRDAAVPLHLAGLAQGRRRLRQGARRASTTSADRGSAVLGLRRAGRPALRRTQRDVTEETSRPAPAGSFYGISKKFGLMVVTTATSRRLSVGYAPCTATRRRLQPAQGLYKTEVVRALPLRNYH